MADYFRQITASDQEPLQAVMIVTLGIEAGGNPPWRLHA
jgi:hypothetical protein